MSADASPAQNIAELARSLCSKLTEDEINRLRATLSDASSLATLQNELAPPPAWGVGGYPGTPETP